MNNCRHKKVENLSLLSDKLLDVKQDLSKIHIIKQSTKNNSIQLELIYFSHILGDYVQQPYASDGAEVRESEPVIGRSLVQIP